MEFTIGKRVLLETLTEFNKIIKPDEHVQMHSYVYVAIKKTSFSLYANDGQIWIRRYFNIPNAIEGNFCIPLKNILRVVKCTKADKSKVTIKKEKEHICVDDSGFISKHVVPDLSRDSYVLFPDLGLDELWSKALAPVVYTSNELGKALKFVSGAVSQDETRENLHGVNFNDNLVVATNGHILRKTELSHGIGGSFLMPPNMVDSIVRLSKFYDGGINVYVGKMTNSKDCRIMMVSFGNNIIVSKELYGTFPDHSQIYPQHNKFEVLVNTKTLRKTLTKFNDYMKRFCGVKCEVSTFKIHMEANGYEAGEFSTDVPLVSSNMGDATLNVGFNCKYFLDSFSEEKEENIKLSFEDDLSPCVIELSNGRSALIMPMRL